MTFELEIEFVGLCLFVPVTDPRSEPAMHVLLPAAGPGHDKDVPAHVARLCVNPAYLQPDLKEQYPLLTALAPMAHVSLALAGSGELAPKLSDDVVDVGAVVGGRIDLRALDEGDGARKLTARVRLGSGRYLGGDPGACWIYPPAQGTRRQLANRVRWTMEMDGSQLDLSLDAFSADFATKLPPLYPIGGRIKIAVYNTPYDELPPEPVTIPKPPMGTPAHHFAAFYTLFDPLPEYRPLPTFYADSCHGSGVSAGGGGSPYTCMTAQALPLASE